MMESVSTWDSSSDVMEISDEELDDDVDNDDELNV